MVTKFEALLDVVDSVTGIEDSEGNYFFVRSVDKLSQTFYCKGIDNEDYYITYNDVLNEDYILYKEVQIDLSKYL